MNDLTKGKPIAVILQFVIPLLIGSFFQLAYNFADSIIVGHTLGKDAFASVGSTASLIFFNHRFCPRCYQWINHYFCPTLWSWRLRGA